ncbi:MAG: hypothetical protein ABH891_02560 [Candidatus Omnitrophota bacterium]
MLLRILSVLFLAGTWICGPLFAAVDGAGSVLPPKRTAQPRPPDTGDGQIEAVEKYEKDPAVEKLSVGVVIQAVWHEDAAYVSRDPSADGPGYNEWDFNCEYGGHFTTRIYKIPQLFHSPKIVVPQTSFTLYSKKITGSATLRDKYSHLVSSNVKFIPSPSIVTGQEKPSPNPFENLVDNSTFQMDFTLSGGVLTPMAGTAPMASLTPFMAIMRPQGAFDMASMNPVQALLDPTVLTNKMKTTYFKLPITIDGFSLNQMKKGPVTKKISDSASGPGLVGSVPHTSGELHCSFDMTVTVFLKNADGGYDPNQKEPGPYVPDGPGTGGPGIVGKKGGSDPGTKPSAEGKRPATFLRDGDASAENAGAGATTLAKAIRILIRALRDMEIQKDAAHFMGADYQNLPVARKRGLLYYFIDEAKKEGVTIRKGAPFYFDGLNGTYSAQPGLSSEKFVKTLTNLIVRENDWTEQA